MTSKQLVITGGSRGIGEATVQHFVDRGWKTINLSRQPCEVPGVLNLSVDLAKPETLTKIAPSLHEAVKDAEMLCLVHNAGFQIKDTVETITWEGLVETLNINVNSAVLLNKILIPLMKPGSAILYLGSMLADRGAPGNASYTISKHALLGLMRATCQDLAGRAISTCCICPGLVETALLRKNMDDAMIQFLLDNYVIGKRLIKPDEIAKVIYHCAENPAMNGSLIPVNLGILGS